MGAAGIGSIVAFLALLVVGGRLLGPYMARVYAGDGHSAGRVWLLGPAVAAGERGFLRLLGQRARKEQTWKEYALSVLVFSVVFELFLYGMLRLQGNLPLNPEGFKAVAPGLSLNTAASFLTNTNWQFYAGESTMSYLSQMAGLAVQNFVSAAVGMAVFVAVVRGFSRRATPGLGNFWVDLYRSIAYILLPLSLLVAVVLVSQGVIQTFAGHVTATTVEGAQQVIARGPAASQVAIKHVGNNGGGFWNSNSAVPFEDPTAFTSWFQLYAEMLIPAGCVFLFGRMIGAMRQAWAIFAVMAVMFVGAVAVAVPAEQHGSQALRDSGVSLTRGGGQAGGNMEGKEVRFGIASSATFAVGTTDTSTGAVIASHDSFTALGGTVPLLNIFVGEVIFGGSGTGMQGMLLFVLLAVFIAGLMVGRTPEYLGKKIEAKEIKLAVVGSLFVPILVLAVTAIAVVSSAGATSFFNPGAHGFTEALYAWTSMGNNNGSAFAGYGGTNFSEYLGAFTMLLGRFVPIIAALGIAGSLATKKVAPVSAGTFRTDTPTFAVLLTGVILIVAGLTVFPALVLGPIVEALQKGVS